MQISRLAAYTTQANRFAAAAAEGRAASTGPTSLEQTFTAARDAIEAKQVDTAKGYTQAARERDAVRNSTESLGRAKEAVQKLQDEKISETDREKYQKQFSEAMAAAGKAGEAQTANKADAKLKNGAYDARRVDSVATDQLGQRASERFSSAAEVAKLDPATADAATLAEAEKVLTAATAQAGKESTAAQRQVDRISGRERQLESASQQFAGETGKAAERNARDLAAIQALFQNQSQTGAGFLNLMG